MHARHGEPVSALPICLDGVYVLGLRDIEAGRLERVVCRYGQPQVSRAYGIGRPNNSSVRGESRLTEKAVVSV